MAAIDSTWLAGADHQGPRGDIPACTGDCCLACPALLHDASPCTAARLQACIAF